MGKSFTSFAVKGVAFATLDHVDVKTDSMSSLPIPEVMMKSKRCRKCLVSCSLKYNNELQELMLQGTQTVRHAGAMTDCQTQTDVVLSFPSGDQTPAGCSETYAHYWQCLPKGLHGGKELRQQHFKDLLNATRHHKTDHTPSSPKSTQRTKQGGRLILLGPTLLQQNANKQS